MLPKWSKNGWSLWHLLGALGLGALAVLVHLEAWRDILYLARRDDENAHIYLVPVVAAWLVWVRWRRVRHCRPRGAWVGLVLAVLGGALSVWGYHAAIMAFWHGGAVLTVVGAVLSVLGVEVLTAFLPAFLVLVFLVPPPGMIRQRIALQLQGTTAQVTAEIFELGGQPVECSVNQLTINGKDVQIKEACNGLRMVFGLFLVSYAYAFTTPLRGYVRFLILAVSPISAIACNVIRLLPVVWLYGFAPERIARQFHDLSGWAMLPLAFLGLMVIIRGLRWALLPVAPYTLAYD